jgi:hypothetical protein
MKTHSSVPNGIALMSFAVFSNYAAKLYNEAKKAIFKKYGITDDMGFYMSLAAMKYYI